MEYHLLQNIQSPEYADNERKYTERESSRQSQGINLKLIIIPILAVAVIGVIVGVSYFSVLSPADQNKQTETPPPPPSDTTEKVTTPPPHLILQRR